LYHEKLLVIFVDHAGTKSTGSLASFILRSITLSLLLYTKNLIAIIELFAQVIEKSTLAQTAYTQLSCISIAGMFCHTMGAKNPSQTVGTNV
jgi:hypothetical protein